jgi:hypothetical protein
MKKAISDWSGWLLWRAITWSLLYLGLFQGVKGAGNVLVVVVWLLVVYSCTWLNAEGQALIRTNGPSAVPDALVAAESAGLVGVLVWHSWWITGIAYLAQWLITIAARSRARAAVPT